MKKFLDESFLLQSKFAERLYHDFAKDLPIIDYHNHLPPDQIANDIRFETMTQAWLWGDHYKWRALRTNGINEFYITGSADDSEKFMKWAETVPYTLRNPLYHWTHLELQRYFGIDKILSPSTATEIYDQCNELLGSPDFSVQNLLTKMNVQVLCTTDDPLDSLEYHQQFQDSDCGIVMRPAFRPDKAMNAEDPKALNNFINKLEAVSGISITDFNDYLLALKSRHDHFAKYGCSISDHGLSHAFATACTRKEVTLIFSKIRMEQGLSEIEVAKFKSEMLYQFAIWNHEKGWVQQFHLGALRNNNSRLLTKLGTDTGFDSIGDFSQATQLSNLLDSLDRNDCLTKTIIYNLNPADNEMMATMIGNFNDGSVAGKIQWGSAWWFLDQKDGMINHLNVLSNMSLLSRFVGMLTDSRSFLSFPRHEYFRRILCNLFATDVENGELPADIDWIGKVIGDICYDNARRYFGFSRVKKPSILSMH